ncbi:zinc finger MYM-type protein 1-like [Hydra vulgaris]|uniref:zinc finger MYM-type protein 1-like n=1 Tax=Hydra vulgaris TaxID=6087 RepID=UPI001F5F9BD2|nr:zinc finger MYM-type protein 1-like [Hydra vulgaris]
MSGLYKGAQALIRQSYSEALYVPCSAHNLNLAGVHAVESAIEIKYKTLTAVNDVSRLLQSEAITTDDELRLIRQLLEDLKQIRGSWLQIFQQAVAVARPLGFETELATKRKRKLKRFYDEASNTAYFHDSQTKEFEVNVFNVGLDSLIQQIDSRFEASRMVANMFSFIWLDNDDLSVQSKACELAQFYPRDVNKEDLIEEVCRFKNARKTIFKQGNPLQLLNQIFKKKLERLFPYIYIMLRIFSTIPVSVAEGEQSFSKLKIIKNSLCSTMGQDHVTDLLIISIEEDLARR